MHTERLDAPCKFNSLGPLSALSIHVDDPTDDIVKESESERCAGASCKKENTFILPNVDGRASVRPVHHDTHSTRLLLPSSSLVESASPISGDPRGHNQLSRRGARDGGRGVQNRQGVRFEHPAREEHSEPDMLTSVPPTVAVLHVDLEYGKR
jgi:hypothetical protein